jgi:lipopolysaccharide export system protein LptA
VTDRIIIGTNFTMTLYRARPAGATTYNPSNQVQLYVQAPLCYYDMVTHGAWNDEGHIVLFTPTTNVFVQGDGFYFTQSNELLSLFRNVETRVLKAVLKSPLLSGPASNAAPAAPQIMKIFAEAAQFDYPANRVDYQRHVHLIDPQMDMTSAFLTVHFNTNGTLESAVARREVVLTTTNKGQATADRGYYYVTNADEMMELTDHANWKNGDEQAQADYFLYDSNLHFLVGSNHVHVRWPNQAPGANSPPGAPPLAGSNGFRRLSSDFITLQMPPTNGPVERMTATGHVLMTNDADHSNSRSEYAVYSRTNDSFELTGHPVWWNDKMEVRGTLLRAELTNQIYHARGNAQFKFNLTAAAATTTNAAPSPRATNRWLNIFSDDLDYKTNLATFHGHVIAHLLENDVLRETLTSDDLVVTLENSHIVQAVATGDVHGRAEPNLAGVTKTISCAILTAYCWPATNLLKDLRAEPDVALLSFSAGPKGATNRLTASVVTAHFSAVTNQMETAVAERHVVLDQWKGAQTAHVTGDRAFYTAAIDRAIITGTPYARTQSYIITGADLLIMEPKTNRFQAVGHYTITPVRAKTNQPPP